MDYKLSPKKIEYDCTLLIPIQVDNIGIGLAIITSITCFDSKNKIDYNCVSNETSRTKVIKKSGSSTFYIEIEGVDRKNLEYLNITVMFQDILEYKYKNTFHVTEYYNESSIKNDWKVHDTHLRERLSYSREESKKDLDMELRYIKDKKHLIARNIIVNKLVNIK